MTSKFLLAAASASFLLAAAGGAMAADAPKPPKLTHAIAVALTDVQKANGTKDYAAAQAASDRTEDSVAAHDLFRCSRA